VVRYSSTGARFVNGQSNWEKNKVSTCASNWALIV